MNRFKLYVMVLVVNIIIFLVSLLLNIEYVAGIVNFICFLVSIILFLFTLEEPPKLSKLKIPEVHSYYKSGQNDYNNAIALEFVLLSFLFFVFLYSFNLNFSFVILLLWGISVPITYFILSLNSKNSEMDKIVNYLKQFEPSASFVDIKAVTKVFISVGNINKKTLVKANYKHSALAGNLVDAYVNYINSSDNSLVAGEIEEINDL